MIIENYNDPKQRGHSANDRVQVNGVGRGIQSKSHCISLWISSFLYGNGIPVCYSRPAVSEPRYYYYKICSLQGQGESGKKEKGSLTKGLFYWALLAVISLWNFIPPLMWI